MKPRILYAGLFHETHSFVDDVTRWADFEVVTDEAIMKKLGDSSPTDGFLKEAQRLDLEVVPTIDARAMPSGIVEDEAFETFWREFEQRARPALAAGISGIFLVLHGAMVTHSELDPEGEFLARCRKLPGGESLPIFGVLDLHANVTARMCTLANGLITYRENPHTDAKESAQRATALLYRCLLEKKAPHMAWIRPPIVWAPPGSGTDTDPMLSLKIFAREVEAMHPEVWACNIAAGFSFADTPDTGLTLSLVTTAPAEKSRSCLATGARLAWELRTRGAVEYPSADEMMGTLQADPSRLGPILLVEPADNIGGGAPGDGTGVLRAFLAHNAQRALVVINDPLAVNALSAAKIGSVHPLVIGGRGSRLDPGPVQMEVTLISKSDGNFQLEDKQSHLASMSGTHIAMGPCAVVRSAGVTILLTSRKTPPFDLGQLRSQSIEPLDFTFIGVKAAIAHKRAYDGIARASYYVDTAGPCSSKLTAFPWQYLHRPVWPLDPNALFACSIS